MKYLRFLTVITGGLTVFLVIVHTIQSCSLVEIGKDVQKIDQEIQVLELTSDDLTSKIASASSLTTITFRAKEIGLNVQPKIVTIEGSQLVALNILP